MLLFHFQDVLCVSKREIECSQAVAPPDSTLCLRLKLNTGEVKEAFKMLWMLFVFIQLQCKKASAYF